VATVFHFTIINLFISIVSSLEQPPPTIRFTSEAWLPGKLILFWYQNAKAVSLHAMEALEEGEEKQLLLILGLSTR
jgi:hypothetical protein